MVKLLQICLFLALSAPLVEPAQPKGIPRISVVPFVGMPNVVGQSVRLSSGEFEILTLLDYEGQVTWDVSDPSIILAFEAKAESEVIGFRAGQTSPGKYTTPKTSSLVVYGVGSGKAVISAWGVEEGKPKKLTSITVESNTAPRPPPGPGPTPEPDPSVAPIPAPGFRVLIVYDADASYPVAQNAIFSSAKIRDYTTAKCAKGPDGKTPEIRMYPKNANLSNESQIWRDAYARPRVWTNAAGNARIEGYTPWIIVSNGKEGYEGPLPANVDDTLKLLKKYGGE